MTVFPLHLLVIRGPLVAHSPVSKSCGHRVPGVQRQLCCRGVHRGGAALRREALLSKGGGDEAAVRKQHRSAI